MAPVFIRPKPIALTISFERDGEPTDVVVALDGSHAYFECMAMLKKRGFLIPGDTLKIRRADGKWNQR